MSETARQEVLFSSHEKPQKTQRGLCQQPIDLTRDSETQKPEKLVTEKWEKKKSCCSANDESLVFVRGFFDTENAITNISPELRSWGIAV